MVSRKQLIISAIYTYLGEPEWLQVADWHPGTGAVVIDLLEDSHAGNLRDSAMDRSKVSDQRSFLRRMNCDPAGSLRRA
jgi:hypothetical protein